MAELALLTSSQRRIEAAFPEIRMNISNARVQSLREQEKEDLEYSIQKLFTQCRREA